MKILFIGNSQLSCIKLAFDKDPGLFASHSVSFYVFPGGVGPHFEIENLKLRVLKWAINSDFPPYAWPPGAEHVPVDDYDLIVVSALGNIYGSFAYPSFIPRQGLLHSFDPKITLIVNRHLSASCFRRLIHSALDNQGGFKFLEQLKSIYSGQIIVQPFPLVSSMLASHPEWVLNQLYEKSLAAHQFFYRCRDEYLSHVCRHQNTHLLGYPITSWTKDYLTPEALMSQVDGLHPNPAYGRLVLEQVANVIDYGAWGQQNNG